MVVPDLSSLKRKYLDGEILTLTVNAAHATRGMPVYVNYQHSAPIKAAVRGLLPEIAAAYSRGDVSESRHFENVALISAELSAKFAQLLHGGRYRIGVAQKLLNLYLKYQWTLGWIEEPPHCPFDDVVIRNLNLPHRINWTVLDSPEQYLLLVEAAREAAHRASLTIACWELCIWSGVSGRGTAQ